MTTGNLATSHEAVDADLELADFVRSRGLKLVLAALAADAELGRGLIEALNWSVADLAARARAEQDRRHIAPDATGSHVLNDCTCSADAGDAQPGGQPTQPGRKS